jgi:hypothetical protein
MEIKMNKYKVDNQKQITIPAELWNRFADYFEKSDCRSLNPRLEILSIIKSKIIEWENSNKIGEKND